MTRTVRIDRDRLWATLMELKEIGAYDDEATGLRGVRRLALTDADAEARRRCVPCMAKTAVVPFDADVQDVVAATCPTAMVFVAGEHGEMSHTPREYSDPHACGNGIDVLANAVLRLVDQA